jgi:hypothetical protein
MYWTAWWVAVSASAALHSCACCRTQMTLELGLCWLQSQGMHASSSSVSLGYQQLCL